MTDDNAANRIEGHVGHWLDRPLDLALCLVRKLGYEADPSDVHTNQRERRLSSVTKVLEQAQLWESDGCRLEINEHERLVETPVMHDSAWAFELSLCLPDGTSLHCVQHGQYWCQGPTEDRVREVIELWLACVG